MQRGGRKASLPICTRVRPRRNCLLDFFPNYLGLPMGADCLIPAPKSLEDTGKVIPLGRLFLPAGKVNGELARIGRFLGASRLIERERALVMDARVHRRQACALGESRERCLRAPELAKRLRVHRVPRRELRNQAASEYRLSLGVPAPNHQLFPIGHNQRKMAGPAQLQSALEKRQSVVAAPFF